MATAHVRPDEAGLLQAVGMFKAAPSHNHIVRDFQLLQFRKRQTADARFQDIQFGRYADCRDRPDVDATSRLSPNTLKSTSATGGT